MKQKQTRSILIAIIVIVVAVIGISSFSKSSPYAYQACRPVILGTDGYGVWKLQSTRSLLFKVQYDFHDGFNTATCEAIGFGRLWSGTKRMETLVACMLSLDDIGGNECPCAKYGVTP
jgi:hypothetical protein